MEFKVQCAVSSLKLEQVAHEVWSLTMYLCMNVIYKEAAPRSPYVYLMFLTSLKNFDISLRINLKTNL